mgnify:FL=1
MTKLLLLLLNGGIAAFAISAALTNDSSPRLGSGVLPVIGGEYRGTYVGGRWVSRSSRLETNRLLYYGGSGGGSGGSSYAGGYGGGGWSGK